MKMNLTRLTTSALALALPLTTYAQTKPAADSANAVPAVTVAPSAGLVNDWLREQCRLSIPGTSAASSARALEVKDYIDTPGQAGQVAFRRTGGDANNTYLLLRKEFISVTPRVGSMYF